MALKNIFSVLCPLSLPSFCILLPPPSKGPSHFHTSPLITSASCYSPLQSCFQPLPTPTLVPFVPFTFLVFVVTLGNALTKDSELGSTNDKEHAVFLFLGYLIQNDIFQFHLFACKFHFL